MKILLFTILSATSLSAVSASEPTLELYTRQQVSDWPENITTNECPAALDLAEIVWKFYQQPQPRERLDESFEQSISEWTDDRQKLMRILREWMLPLDTLQEAHDYAWKACKEITVAKLLKLNENSMFSSEVKYPDEPDHRHSE